MQIKTIKLYTGNIYDADGNPNTDLGDGLTLEIAIASVGLTHS